jgi:tryptophan 2,3-dioxygenase
MLFIVQHQTSELWMKLMLHEMRAVRTHLQADDLPPAFKMLARVARIMDQLVHAWDVLATMTPPEYTAIRPIWAPRRASSPTSTARSSSSWEQERGPAQRPRHHAGIPVLEEALRTPSIYDEAIKLLARNGLPIAERLNADWTQPTVADDSVQQAWLEVYRDPTRYWALYELAEKLVDMETAFRFWRFRHVTTVERIIGFKTGTGGTAGVSYLRKMLDVVLFPNCSPCAPRCKIRHGGNSPACIL